MAERVRCDDPGAGVEANAMFARKRQSPREALCGRYARAKRTRGALRPMGPATNSAAADKRRVRNELQSLKRSLLSDSSEFHKTYKPHEIQANEVCRRSDSACARRFW